MTKREIKPQKTTRVASLRELIKKSKSVAVVDYTHMTVPQATELRKQVHTVGGDIKVEKNTLFKIASGLPLELHGLSAFVFSNNDEISALKIVSDFIKKNNVLSFKSAVLGDKILTSEEAILLSQTPSKEASIGKLLYLLNFNMSKLVRTLKEVTFKNE